MRGVVVVARLASTRRPSARASQSSRQRPSRCSRAPLACSCCHASRERVVAAPPSPASAWIGLAYLVVFGSLVGFTAFAYALAELPASVVGTYAYVNPVVAVVLGAVLLSETVSTHLVFGAGLILAGSYSPRSRRDVHVSNRAAAGKVQRSRSRIASSRLGPSSERQTPRVLRTRPSCDRISNSGR